MNLNPGTTIGPYEIVSPLGAGGMGEVYRARDSRLGRDVAIKALPTAFAADTDRLARFEREAKLLASLSHPNIAGIYGIEEVGAERYLVLEFVEGETLADRIARAGKLSAGEAVASASELVVRHQGKKMRNAWARHWTLLVALLASPIVAPGQSASDDRRHVESKDGLKIESGANQGMTHTDTLGTRYNYRYVTSIITNDGTAPIHLRIALSNQYDYPAAYGDRKYKVFLLPKELTPDTASLSNNITDGLGNFLDRCLQTPYVLDQTLEPREQCVVTIGTLYPQPTDCGIVPSVLFAQSDGDDFEACDSSVYQERSSDSQVTLAVKLDSCGGCILIPCGQISYPEP